MENVLKVTYILGCLENSRICGHAQMIFKCSNGSNSNFMCRMVLEWREHEHGDVEEAVRADLMA